MGAFFDAKAGVRGLLKCGGGVRERTREELKHHHLSSAARSDSDKFRETQRCNVGLKVQSFQDVPNQRTPVNWHYTPHKFGAELNFG